MRLGWTLTALLWVTGAPLAWAEPDYSGYHQVLREHVGELGLVDYRALSHKRDQLDHFLDGIAVVSESEYKRWNRLEQIAFWINAYNALTLRVVREHYPVNSIRDIPGVWSEAQHTVAGRQLSLDQIEHEILRSEFGEPRVHFALVCAAIGCPKLRTEPYRGGALEAQLEEQARRFLSQPQNFRLDPRRSRLHVSSIFKWFGQDFVPRSVDGKPADGKAVEAAVHDFVRKHAPPEQAALLERGDWDLRYLYYDWALNDLR